MSERVNVSGLTDAELKDRVNDCRIRILEELGMEVPESLKMGEGDGAD